MTKQENSFLLGISFSLLILLFSISSAYATETTSKIPFSTMIRGIAVDNNDRLIVTQPLDKSIAVFDANGDLEFTITHDTFSDYGVKLVSTDSNNRIIAGDTANDNIYIFDSFGNFEKMFSLSSLSGDLTTDSNNRIIALDYRNVHVFDSTGILEFTITNDILGYPFSVTTDSADRIIVADSNNDDIYIFDKFGNLEFSIVKIHDLWRNNHDENIFYRHVFIDMPVDIITDSQDRIIVADDNGYGEVVHIFDKYGNYKEIIKKEERNYMWSQILETFPEVSLLMVPFDWGKSINGLAIDSHDRIIVSTAESVNTVVVSSIITEETKNTKSCVDCTPPTIGKDSQGKRFVDYGLVLNGVAFQAENFKTHMNMQYTEVGKENHLEVKVYENGGPFNLDFLQFGIVKEIGSAINIFEPRFEIDISNFSNDIENPSMDGVELIDKKGIISEYRVDTSLVECMEGSDYECLKLDIYWIFEKVPEFQVLVLNGWDDDNNSFTHYFNDGLTTIDSNYVEPIPEEPYKYICNDKPLDEIMNGGDRNNCHWRAANMWLWK